MKLQHLFSGLLFGLLVAAAGCSEDKTKDEPGPGPEPVPTTRTLTFNVAYQLTGNTDDLHFAWTSGDSEKLGILGGTSGKLVNSTKLSIGDTQAAFTGTISVDDASVYCFYPTSSNASLTFAAFPFAAARTQTNAGDELTGEQLPLISDAISIPEEGETVDVAAKAVPTILRLGIFSSDEALQSEVVKNVTLQTEEKINGTYTWNFSLKSGSVTEGSGISTVALSNPYNLSDVGAAADAKSIYMIVAPVAVKAGYKYTISTDKAAYIYTVNAAGDFGMGKILDVPVDLKDAERQEKGIITFDASALDGYECDANAPASTVDIGAFTALVSGTPSTDYAADFYKKLTFQVKDADGNAASWVTPTLGADGHINLTWELNPAGTERTVTVTANFTLTDDAYWYAGNPAFTFDVKQKPTTVTYDFKNLPEAARIINVTAEGLTAERDLGYYFAYVNGSVDKAPNDKMVFYNFGFVAVDKTTGAPVTWVKAYCKNDNNHMFVSCDPNPDAGDRAAVITVNNLFSGEKEMEISVSQHGTATPSVITYKVTASQYTFPAAGETDKDPNWYYLAYIDGNAGQEVLWAKYYNLNFEVVGDDGQPVTWVRVKRKAGDSNHVLLTCDANDGGLRRAYIKGSYVGDQYAVADKNPILNVPVVQTPSSGHYVTYTWSKPEVVQAARAWANVDIGYYHAYVDGSTTTDQAGNGGTITERYNITFTLTSLTEGTGTEWIESIKTDYNNGKMTGNHVYCKISENKTGAPRTVLVQAHYQDAEYSALEPAFTFTITQSDK